MLLIFFKRNVAYRKKEQRAYLRLFKFLKVRCDIEEDSIHGTRQRDASAKQDEQHKVRICG